MYKRILVAIDGSNTAKCGLHEAIKLAKELGSTLCIAHVLPNLIVPDFAVGEPIYYESIAVDMRDVGMNLLKHAVEEAGKAGIQAESALLESEAVSPADPLLAHAKEWQAELLVMGTHGRRGLRRLALGSDAEMILRESPVPVLLVRSTGDN